MRDDALNLENYSIRTERTNTKHILTLQVCYREESELKQFLVDETLSQICSIDKEEPKGIIAHECYMEEDKSECVHKNINKQKNAKNEIDSEESSVTY